ncbi:MAG: MotA/TolQ/ExbB proton channel family protein [Pseudomonadota bacterium]
MVFDFSRLTTFLDQGGPAIWAIFALSVILLASILFKILQFTITGVWRYQTGYRSQFQQEVEQVAMQMEGERAEAEITRIANEKLADVQTQFRLLELISTIAPLIGLLGTVLGMIAAFQALQESGSQADPSVLAGGIWEALLTTAAGMAVAIPASAALTWFETVADRLRLDFEAIAIKTVQTTSA